MDQLVSNIYGYIYKITNLINRKMYIGQTINSIEGRWNNRLYYVFKTKSNSHICNSIRKYGVENFKVEELLKCFNREDLDFFEDYYIIVYDAMDSKKGYNKMRGGWGFHEFSMEVILRRAKSLRKYLLNPDNKNKLIERNKKISKTVKEYSNGIEVKKEFKERMERWHSIPENKKKHKKATREAMNNPEVKEKHRRAVKEGRKKYCKERSIKYEKARQENDISNMKYDDLYKLAKNNKVKRYGYISKYELIDNLQKIYNK